MLFAPFELLEEFREIKKRYILYLFFRRIVLDPLMLDKRYEITYDKTIALW